MTAPAKLFQLSLTELSDISGVATRTIRKRLANLPPVIDDGYKLSWNPRDALPLIFELGKATDGSNKLDLQQERARLAKAQTEKARLEVQILRGNVIPAEVVETVWSDMLSKFKAKTLALPSKASMPAYSCESIEELERLLKDEVFDLLNELRAFDLEEYIKISASKFGRAANGPAESEEDA